MQAPERGRHRRFFFKGTRDRKRDRKAHGGHNAGCMLSRRGTCSAGGWAPLRAGSPADGPNCTYIGRRDWHGALLVGSCARNVRPALEQHQRAWVTSLLDRTAGSLLIFEDEQRAGDPDGTRAALRGWAAADDRVRLLLAQPLLYPQWSRTQRLALCRNQLVREAAASLSAHGTFLSLDLDCHAPPVDRLVRVIASMATQPWDVLTVNTRAPTLYYDRWALRSNTLGLNYDCWFNSTQRKMHGSCPEYAITIDPAAPTLAVDSAFNGLGLYRAAALRSGADCRYRGTKNSYMCEHVPYHLCLRKHRLAIGVLPSLATACGAPILSRRRRHIHYLANGSVQMEAYAASIDPSGKSKKSMKHHKPRPREAQRHPSGHRPSP